MIIPSTNRILQKVALYTPASDRAVRGPKFSLEGTWSLQGDQNGISGMSLGMNRELFKVFKKYGVGNRAIIVCGEMVTQ